MDIRIAIRIISHIINSIISMICILIRIINIVTSINRLSIIRTNSIIRIIYIISSIAGSLVIKIPLRGTPVAGSLVTEFHCEASAASSKVMDSVEIKHSRAVAITPSIPHRLGDRPPGAPPRAQAPCPARGDRMDDKLGRRGSGLMVKVLCHQGCRLHLGARKTRSSNLDPR